MKQVAQRARIAHLRVLGSRYYACPRLYLLPWKPNLKLIQALMNVIITCKYEKDQTKNSREKVETSFSHYKPMVIFSDVQRQITPQSVVQSG